MQQEFTGLRSTVMEMEQSLSTWTDDIVHLQAKVCQKSWPNWRINAKIWSPGLIAIIYTLLVCQRRTYCLLQMCPCFWWRHFSLGKRRLTCSRAMVVKLHYYVDCTRILQKARELQRVQINNMTIAVLPDHTAKTARCACKHSGSLIWDPLSGQVTDHIWGIAAWLCFARRGQRIY